MVVVLGGGCRATPPAPVEAAPLPTRLPAASRVIAIGDLHGDLDATKKALRLAGVLGPDDAWIGGETVVVQVGDQLDRGDDEPEILALLARLAVEARASGGAVIPLIGNHEAMNVVHDLRYVTPEGFTDYEGHGGRRAAFAPGGPIARQLAATHRAVVVVGDTAFVHGGLRPEHVAAGLDQLNRDTRLWLLGAGPAPPALGHRDGPLWNRQYSMDTSEAACAQLVETLKAIPARRLVVAHTVQAQGINAACDGRVWRVDVGLSAHYGGPVQVLELTADGPKVLAAER